MRDPGQPSQTSGWLRGVSTGSMVRQLLDERADARLFQSVRGSAGVRQQRLEYIPTLHSKIKYFSATPNGGRCRWMPRLLLFPQGTWIVSPVGSATFVSGLHSWSRP